MTFNKIKFIARQESSFSRQANNVRIMKFNTIGSQKEKGNKDFFL